MAQLSIFLLNHEHVTSLVWTTVLLFVKWDSTGNKLVRTPWIFHKELAELCNSIKIKGNTLELSSTYMLNCEYNIGILKSSKNH